ncbi:MAG TPA: flavodoxin family protein [Clostridia bacterium]|nr:flavodoxin family protein [Clostridia bacterium]
MKTLIVYDSVFGNTEKIAKAMGDSLGNQENVEVLKVTDINLDQLTGVNLLIVGSPTRAFKPTKATVDFLIKIPLNGLNGINVAAFDTRISATDVNSKVLNGFVKIFGYAAKPIADKLVKKGGKLIIQPEGFYVKESEGPLRDGELERAAEWVKSALNA